MTKKIDYYETTVLCPNCQEELIIQTTRKKDKDTGTICAVLPMKTMCHECRVTFTADELKKYNYDVFDNIDA